jgi:predicted nuclease with TOPRIM domain
MGSLKDLFVESYIEVPEAKTDLFEQLEGETAIMKESLELAEAESLELSEKVEKLSREKILSEQSKDLASTQVEKLKALTEEVEFVSEEVFAEKVTTIKSSVFSASTSNDIVEESHSETEVIVEGESGINEHVSNDMKKYLSALTRIKENNPNGK